MNTLEYVTVYEVSEDTPEEDCFGGDYADVVLFLEDGTCVNFGDEYHNKGYDCCKSYIEGYSKGKGVSYRVKGGKIKLPYGEEIIKENVIWDQQD